MNVLIISAFDTYEERIDLIKNFYLSNGNNVKVIQSNFRHFKKEFREESKADYILVDAEPYYKNLSFGRLKSHYNYSKNVFLNIQKYNPDLIYVLVPPNSLVKFAAKYKEANPEVKLVFDLVDLWPETMPIGFIKKIPIMKLWNNIRNNYINLADYIVTECDLYRKVLEHKLPKDRVKTIYLAKEELPNHLENNMDDENINLCYLGSINNIIDIDKISELILELSKYKKVIVHIIGDGEKRDDFINSLKKSGAEVIFYGPIYDEVKKRQIFSKCNFGINIMKKEVCVGLTMKSLDYFQYGLPIINNIKGDSTRLIDVFKIGININEDKMNLIGINKLSIEDYLKLRNNVENMFREKFSIYAFNKNMVELQRSIQNEE